MSKQYRPRKEIYVTEDKYKIITKAKGKQSFSSYVVETAYERAQNETWQEDFKKAIKN